MKRFGLLLLASALLGHAPALAQQPDRADLLLSNGNVITMNPKQPRAEAVAVREGRIAWVGSAAEAQRRFPNPTKTIDLNGATVLPGIIDGHGHLLSLGDSFLKLNLKDVPTEREIVEMVRQKAQTAAPGEWILGWGWDEGKWAANYPTHHGLTEAAPNNPVFLSGLHSFAAWVNQKALEMAGIDKDTKDPDKGRIIRDQRTGEPTGILADRAQELVARRIPPLTGAQMKQALELAGRECVRHGLTSVHEARVSPAMIEAFRELIQEGRLPVRVYVMLDGADRMLVNQWLERGPEIDRQRQRLTIRSVKLFADGALGSRGAYLFEPYTDEPKLRGVITTPESEIESVTRRCLARGFQVCTHAIGDAANHMTLNAYERALAATPGAKDTRLRIEHAQVLSRGDIPRLVKLGVIASMQPTHATSDMPWAEKRVGPSRIAGAYAWRSVLDTGARVTINSDFPGETLDPFHTIYAAVTRCDPKGQPKGGWYPEQRMTLEEALRGYTVEAAYAGFEEDVKGSIEPGKLADLTVIAKDITKLAPEELLTLSVLKTFINGELVYDAAK